MRVAGIAVKMGVGRRPSARLAVVVDVAGAAVDVVDEFTSDDAELSTQLHDLAEAVGSRLTGLAVDRVVLRRADQSPVPRSSEGPRVRLLAEGAIVSAARAVVVDTRVATGQDAGRWYGSNKAGVDADARQLLVSQALDEKYGEAVGAALAGLAIN